MCQKDMGDLSFHDIELFNQALLVKKLWRILKNPFSLVSCVMKCRYFPSCSILEANLGQFGLYLWKGLCQGRELLLKGIRKFVGNGESTLAFGTPRYHVHLLLGLLLQAIKRIGLWWRIFTPSRS